MSTIYIGERQSGKTTMLIEMSEKTGATIVVATYPMAKYIQLLAARMGKKKFLFPSLLRTISVFSQAAALVRAISIS